MSRIEACVEQLRLQNKKALVPYLAAGDPDIKTTLQLMHTLVECGSDIIEIGVPFSDPMADGPVIQHAYERALAAGVNLDHILAMVAEFRQSNAATPVVLMGYLNGLEVIGYETYIQRAKNAGVDGFIIVDLPPEEAEDVSALCVQYEMNLIFLIAPTTTPERVKLIADHASGYLYYVSLKGVTGASNLNVEEVAEKVAVIKSLTSLPVTVGFGIKDAATASAVAKVSDGVVVGSAIVSRVEAAQGDAALAIKEVKVVAESIRSALDAC